MQTCLSVGLGEGEIVCGADCRLDLLGCQNTSCGSGEIEPPEECDGEALGDATCQSLGFEGGTLSCSSNCTFDTVECLMSGCGDGIVQSREACDGVLAPSVTCAALGYDYGEVTCTDACRIDTSSCGHYVCCTATDEPGCSDDEIESCVCAKDPYCCGEDDAMRGVWDDVCVDVVADCGGTCA